MTVVLKVCTLLQSLSPFHYQSLVPSWLLNAAALTAQYTWLWSPSKRDNPISALLCGLVACLQPWARCRVIPLLHLLGKAWQDRWALHTNLIMAGLLHFFFIFFGRGDPWTLMVGGSTRGIFWNTISSIPGSSIMNGKAIFNSYFVLH